MNAVMDWTVRLFTAGLTDEERKKFVAALWRMAIFMHVLWAWGFLGAESGFARAKDVPEGLQRQLDTIISQLERSNENQRRMLQEDIAQRIRDLYEVCESTPPKSAQRRRIISEIEVAQIEYEELTRNGGRRGSRYSTTLKCE